MVAGLRHPNIVTVYDIGVTDDLLYISMEYVGGGSLDARLKNTVECRDVFQVLTKIASALSHAHQNGIVHRDVKPANILFRDDSTPLLSDFGIAKQTQADLELTSTGTILGSPFYMSPEQAEGRRVDGRADIYSLGIVFFEMLLNRRPFRGTTAVQVLMQHIQAPVPRLPRHLQGFQTLLNRMIAKDPAERFGDAEELARYVAQLDCNALSAASSVAPPAPRESLSDATEVVAPAQSKKAFRDQLIHRFRQEIQNDMAGDRIVVPSLPDVVLRVRQVMEDAASNSADITRAIGTDPALSAQIVRLANSAYYGAGNPVNNLQRAVTRLGNDVVHHVVMLLVVAQIYNVQTRPRIRPHLENLWRHSTLIACIGELLARRVSGLEAEVAMLAGLIHDIGVLPILVRAEEDARLMSDPETLNAVVASLHPEVGQAVLEEWRYPPDLVAVAAEHENLGRDQDDTADYVDIVLAANLLSHALDDHPLASADWAGIPAMEKLGVTGELADELLREATATVDGLRNLLSG